MKYFLLAVLVLFSGCNHSDSCTPAPAPVAVPAPPAPPAPNADTPPTTAPVVVDPNPPAVIPATGTKRAVLVGINKFLDPGAPPLSGCVNDANAIKAKAISSWGFAGTNITMLLDEQATVAAVKAALEAGVAASKPGDTFLYWQSSHGAEDAVTADASGEPDHMNQMVCCYDFGWDRAHELCDKDFVQIFSKLPDGVIFGWGSDTCHSGDLDKEIVGKHARHIKRKEMPQPAYVKARVARAKAKGLKARSIVGGLLDVGFVSGCKADQTSADTVDDNGVPGGAMTIYFLKTIDAHANDPLATEVDALDAALVKDGYDQNPQAEGAARLKAWLKSK